MHAVVNKLTLSKPLDEALLARMRDELLPRMRSHSGFIELRIVNVSPGEAILLVFFASGEAMVEASRDIAAPWFAEHVRPYLGGPVQRSTGEVWIIGDEPT